MWVALAELHDWAVSLLLGPQCRAHVGLRSQGARCRERRLHDGEHRAVLRDGVTVVRWDHTGAWCQRERQGERSVAGETGPAVEPLA